MKKKTILYGLIIAAVAVVGAWSMYNRLSTTFTRSQEVQLQNGQTFNLTADEFESEINGKNQDMLAYNGSIPGPTLKVKQGESITVEFKNKLDQDTAVHFHGIRADNASDGVVGVTQDAVKPGGTFTYKLTFPDPGAYWYHPHMREDATQPLGLYGSIIVEPKDTAYWTPVNKELPLMIGDILMDADKIAPFDSKQVNFTLMGRFGNTMLVNGETNYEIKTVPGEVTRLYLTNVANTRPFKLALTGGKMKLVGSDGGAYERQTFVDAVTIGPSERAIVDVMFDKTGSFKLLNQTQDKTYDLARINVKSGSPKTSYVTQFNSLAANNNVIDSIDPLRGSFNKAADKTLTLSLDMPGMNMGDNSMPADINKIEWEDTMPFMNKSSTTKSLTWKLIDQETKSENDKINWTFKRGQQVKMKIFNDPNSAHAMQHPIHIHGQRFLVTSVNGQPVDNQVWKDTVLIGKGDTVELLVDMSNPGTWLIHCHIPEHMESGMKLKYKVE